MNIKFENINQAPMTIGQLIVELSNYDPDLPLCIHQKNIGWHDVSSYRGYYDHLAIEPGECILTVKDAQRDLQQALGRTFVGYKGGEYTMTETTPVWVANWGQCSRYAVCGVGDWVDGTVMIEIVEIVS